MTTVQQTELLNYLKLKLNQTYSENLQQSRISEVLLFKEGDHWKD